MTLFLSKILTLAIALAKTWLILRQKLKKKKKKNPSRFPFYDLKSYKYIFDIRRDAKTGPWFRFFSSNPFKQENVSSCFKGLKIDPAEKIEIIYSHQIFALLCMRLKQIGKVWITAACFYRCSKYLWSNGVLKDVRKLF